MITLFTILFIFGLISAYRINRACKKKGIPFNPFESTLIDYFGFLFGVAFTIASIIILILKYLP